MQSVFFKKTVTSQQSYKVTKKSKMSNTKKDKILIVGAGLCGTLLALRMAQRGYNVELREKRSDIRAAEFVGGRSINMALSDRG